MGVTINQLAEATTLSSGDKFPIFAINQGDARKTSLYTVTRYVSENLGAALGDSLVAQDYVIAGVGCLVSALPAAVVAKVGARATVTNASAALTAGIGTIVVGGGANIVPVFCDGTNWRIG